MYKQLDSLRTFPINRTDQPVLSVNAVKREGPTTTPIKITTFIPYHWMVSLSHSVGVTVYINNKSAGKYRGDRDTTSKNTVDAPYNFLPRTATGFHFLTDCYSLVAFFVGGVVVVVRLCWPDTIPCRVYVVDVTALTPHIAAAPTVMAGCCWGATCWHSLLASV